MTEHEIRYKAELDGAVAAIVVDPSFLGAAPDRARPTLLGLRIQLRDPRPDGLSSDAEMDSLAAIERAWTQSITRFDARPVGQVTTAGSRQLFAYAPSDAGFAAAMSDLQSRFPGYHTHAVAQADAGWGLYLGVLCPDEEALLGIQDRAMVDALRDSGDDPATPRPVSHHAWFPGELSRDAYAQRAARLGFVVAPDGLSTADGPRPYGVVLERTHACDADTLASMSRLLRNLAASLRGEYDGCATRVVV